jgi:hypothetical protein
LRDEVGNGGGVVRIVVMKLKILDLEMEVRVVKSQWRVKNAVCSIQRGFRKTVVNQDCGVLIVSIRAIVFGDMAFPVFLIVSPARSEILISEFELGENEEFNEPFIKSGT